MFLMYSCALPVKVYDLNNNKNGNERYNSELIIYLPTDTIQAEYAVIAYIEVKNEAVWGNLNFDEKIKSYVDFTSTGLDMNKLMTEDIPPLQYAVEPILPEGFACVAGRPKSMKSWTMLDLIFCIQNR